MLTSRQKAGILIVQWRIVQPPGQLAFTSGNSGLGGWERGLWFGITRFNRTVSGGAAPKNPKPLNFEVHGYLLKILVLVWVLHLMLQGTYSSYQPSHEMASLLFLKPAGHAPSSGPLHWLWPLFGILALGSCPSPLHILSQRPLFSSRHIENCNPSPMLWIPTTQSFFLFPVVLNIL